MANRTHTCVFFDDGDLDVLCVCGARAVHVLEDDGGASVLVLLDDDAPVPYLPTAREPLVYAATA